MSEKNLHQLAAIYSYRFPTSKGDMLVEDLYSLPLQTNSTSRPSLDSIAVALHNRLQAAEVSFVKPSSSEDSHTKNMLELVKEVIAYRQAKAADEATRKEKAERRRIIKEMLHNKRLQALEAQDLETLERELKELGDD